MISDENGQYLDSDGNRVNVDFYDGRLNVNNYWDDNRNDYLGVAASRNFHHQAKISPRGEILAFRISVFNPATDHPSYFIKRFLKMQIGFVVYGFYLVAHTKENPH